MSSENAKILVTGANGQLGRLVVSGLIEKLGAARVVAAVRRPDAASDLAALGVEIREADYDRPETLRAALSGVEKVLLISSSEIGKRVAQHEAVIEAAEAAGVSLVAYTSVLHADRSKLGLAEEHRQTEALLAASGVPFTVLRNGWYTENYTASIPPALGSGSFYGSARDGKISSAARADYAAAAVAVLTASGDQSGRIHELAGDEDYTLAEFSAEIAAASGKPIGYVDLPEADYRAALVGAGLPEPVAGLLANSDAAAAEGALFDDGGTLRALIGRATTPWRETVRAAVG